MRGAGRFVATTGASDGLTILTVGSGTFAGALADGSTSSRLELVKAGAGTLVLSGKSTFATTRLDGGTLEIAGVSAAGGSGIAFGASSPGKLVIDNAALQNSPVVAGKGHVFGSVINGFGVGDVIDLAGFGEIVSVTSTVARSVNSITLKGSGVTGGIVTLQLAAIDTYGTGFDAATLGSDGHGGTLLTVGKNPTRGSVTLATFTNDAATLGKVAGGVAVAHSAAHILAGLPKLAAAPTHVAAIAAIDKTVVVGTSTFRAYRTTLDKIAGGFALRAAAAALSPMLDALADDASHIKSVTLTDASPPTFRLSQAQAARDASLLAKITGRYIIKVTNTDGSTTTTGHGDGLTLVGSAHDTLTGGGSSETFVLHAGFGQGTITDFYQHMSGSTHDTVTLPKREFAEFAAVLHDATYSSAGATLTAPRNGDQLTLPKVTAAALQQAQAAFKFV